MLKSGAPTRKQIDDLVHLRLSADEQREMLVRLKFEDANSEIVRHFVEAIRDTADEEFLTSFSQFEETIDCCGTGGSGLSRFNTSTTVAFVLAAAGLNVVKFGNRSARNGTGSFDFIEALGLPVELPLKRSIEMLKATNLALIFAPQCYPILKNIAELRRSINQPTIFNCLGPLLNPALPSYRLVGTPTQTMQKLLCDYLAGDASKRSLVVRSDNGLDELDPQSNALIMDISNGSFVSSFVEAQWMQPLPLPKESNVHTLEDNVKIFTKLLYEPNPDSYYLHLVALNAGAALYCAGHAGSIEKGKQKAADLILSRAAARKFDQIRRAYARRIK